jgi:hypothetical protein
VTLNLTLLVNALSYQQKTEHMAMIRHNLRNVPLSKQVIPHDSSVDIMCQSFILLTIASCLSYSTCSVCYLSTIGNGQCSECCCPYERAVQLMTRQKAYILQQTSQRDLESQTLRETQERSNGLSRFPYVETVICFPISQMQDQTTSIRFGTTAPRQ